MSQLTKTKDDDSQISCTSKDSENHKKSSPLISIFKLFNRFKTQKKKEK